MITGQVGLPRRRARTPVTLFRRPAGGPGLYVRTVTTHGVHDPTGRSSRKGTEDGEEGSRVKYPPPQPPLPSHSEEKDRETRIGKRQSGRNVLKRRRAPYNGIFVIGDFCTGVGFLCLVKSQ